MEGRITVTKHGRNMTALAAWRQVTGADNATIVKATGLSDRTIAKALQGGGTISAGSASLLSVYTCIRATTIHAGITQDSWVFDFDLTRDIDMNEASP
jgi:hypothetical protein